MSNTISFLVTTAAVVGVFTNNINTAVAIVGVITNNIIYVITNNIIYVITNNIIYVITNNLNKRFASLLFLIGAVLMSLVVKAQSTVQLAPPLLKYESAFFKNTATATLKFAQHGTRIYYTLNNQTPTVKSLVYSKPIQIKTNFTSIKAMVAGAGFTPSEIVAATFIKNGLKIKTVEQTPPNERYKGNGANTLIDNKGGITAVTSGTWLGYQTDSVEINITLEKPQPIAAVLVNALQDYGSWVFLPQQIKLYYFNKSNQSFHYHSNWTDTSSANIAGASCKPIVIPLAKKVVTDSIKIVLVGVKSLPDWHQGKGKPGWLFIDEIKLY